MTPIPITEDYYMILEVVPTATLEQVKSSYKRLALKLHPDRNTKHDATETFQLVRQFLSDQAISSNDHQIIVY